MGQILSLLLAIFKAIPALKELWDELVTLYVSQRIEAMKDENRAAIRKAIESNDQRPIEIAIGSPKAGEASGIDGTVIVDSLPGVGVHNSRRD